MAVDNAELPVGRC